jgi:hypothetical protein
MKRLLFLLSALLLFFTFGCTQPDAGNGSSDTVNESTSGTMSDGSSYIVTAEGDNSNKYVMAIIENDASKKSFAVVKTVTNGTEYYKYNIEIGNKTEAYTSSSYGKMTLMSGSTQIPAESAVCDTGKSSDNNWFVFKVQAAADSSSITLLKRQVTMTVMLINTAYDTTSELSEINSAYSSQIHSLQQQLELGLLTRTEYNTKVAEYTKQRDAKIAALEEKVTYTYQLPGEFFSYLQSYI